MFSLFLEEDSEGYAYYTPHVIETKKSLYAIKLPKKIYFDGNITQEAIDDAYKSLFVREFERNLTPEEQLDSTNYFGILSILEKKTITAPNGETMLVKDYLKDRETLDGQEQFIKQNIILPMLQEVVRDLRERVEELGLLDEINKLVVTGPSVGNINSKIGNLAINYLIYWGNYTQLDLGDSNFKDDKDYAKRAAGSVAMHVGLGSDVRVEPIMLKDVLKEITITDRNGNYLVKTVSSIDVGISTKKVIYKRKLILNLKYIFPNKNFDTISENLKKK